MKEETPWQQPTPTPSDSDPFYSPGITKLLALYIQINALHSMFVGTYSKLLTSFQPNTGIDDTQIQPAHSASFAKFQQELQASILHVADAENRLRQDQLLERLTQAATSKPTPKP